MNILTLKLPDGRQLSDIKNKDEADEILIQLKYEISDLKFRLDQSWAESLGGEKANPTWLADTRAALREAEALEDAVRLYQKKLKRESSVTNEIVRQSILIDIVKETVDNETWSEFVTEQRRRIDLYNRGEYLPKKYASGLGSELKVI